MIGAREVGNDKKLDKKDGYKREWRKSRCEGVRGSWKSNQGDES